MERSRTLSDFGLHPEFHQQPKGALRRQSSAERETESNAILDAVEAGDHDETRKLLHFELLGHTGPILSPSMHMEHELRTPLMAAAATGDLSLFKTVLNAVERAIRGMRANLNDKLLLQQLEMLDSNGRTLLMHSVRSGNVAILETVLARIGRFKWELMLDKDYDGKTVLMHAALSGRAAVFKQLFLVMNEHIEEKKFIAHILKDSDDGRTILMHAARCGDHRALSAVVLACKKRITPCEMRELLEEVDGEEMTFLMHAAAGCCEGTADETESKIKKKKEEREEKRKEEKRNQELPTLSGLNFTTSTPPAEFSGVPTAHRSSVSSGMMSILESKEDDSKDYGDHVEAATSGSGTTYPVAESPLGHGNPDMATVAAAVPAAVEATQNDPGHDATPQRDRPSGKMSNAPHGGEENKQITRKLISKSKVLEKELLVFRVAWLLVKEMLWKEQVRDQLRARDCWGQTILTHAVVSGRLQVFDAALDAVRDTILDYEIEDLMGINKDDNEVTVMEASLLEASGEMVDLVNRRDQELKTTISIREKASTIEAKIQSFIPGKSIVIFQLLLPEMKDAKAATILLIVMSVLAPIFAYGINLITKETPSTRKNPMLSKASLLLAAPAMWWWGIGTSNIAQEYFGWSETSSAASLAVATIVIPALDQFLGSHKMENMYDVLFLRRRRFTLKGKIQWKNIQKEDAKKPKDDGDSWREGTSVQIDPQRMDAQTGKPRPFRPATADVTHGFSKEESMA